MSSSKCEHQDGELSKLEPLLTLTPRPPGFVAEVNGIDLRHPLAPEKLAEITSAVDMYPVLVFSGQKIDDPQQLSFGQNFGHLEVSLTGALPGYATHRVDPRV